MSDFINAMERIDRGAVTEVADDRIRDVIDAVNRTGKKGSVTVELHFAPNGKSKVGGLSVTGKVKAKAPEVDFGQSFFFTDKNGGLSRTPPVGASDDLLKREGAE